VRREILISTRFGDVPQLTGHDARRSAAAAYVYSDSVTSARFHPNGGDYVFCFKKDIGGGEWYQLYRYDVKTAT
jgi:hypothetical protein